MKFSTCIRSLFFILLLYHPYEASGQIEAPLTPLLIALNLDGVNKKEVYRCYKDKQGKIWLSEDDYRIMGFPKRNDQALHYKNRVYFPLDAYEGVIYDLDEQAWVLHIQTPMSWHPKQVISTEIPLENKTLRPSAPGVFLNYNASSGHNGFLRQDYASAFTEAGVFTRYGVGLSSFLVNGYDFFQNRNDCHRLDTTWILDMPERIASWRFGDAISSGLSWNGAVHFAGVQYSTNFATQPNLVTMPQPSVSGEANLPSSIDILVNGINAQHQSVNSGGYQINQIPVVTGQGTIQVVATDVFGRQQVNSIDYYASPLLLKPGLSSFSYELGRVRWAYGNENFSYGRALGTGTYSLGVTNRYTTGLHLEVLKEQQNVGMLNNYLLDHFGVFSLGFAASHNDIVSRRGSGGLVNIGFSRQARYISYGIQSTLATHDYLQLGMFSDTVHPNLTLQSYLGLATENWGSFSLSYTHINNTFFNPQGQFTYDSFLHPDNRIFIVNYNKNLWKNLFLNVGIISGLNNNNQGFVNLVVPLDGDKSLSVNENVLNNQHQETLQLNKNLPLGNGYGYQLTAATNKNNPIVSQFEVQTNKGLVGASYLGFEGANSAAVNARGSIIGFDRRIFLARYVDQAFALVEVRGLDRRSVYSRNQVIGKTNKKGYLYIPELLPYQPNEIYIDNRELPLNAQVNQYTQTVVPYYKSGVLVKFDVVRMQNTLLTITLPDGSFAPAGASLVLDQGGGTFPVAYSGQVFISSTETNNLSGQVVWEGGQCAFKVVLSPSRKLIKKETVLCD